MYHQLCRPRKSRSFSHSRFSDRVALHSRPPMLRTCATPLLLASALLAGCAARPSAAVPHQASAASPPTPRCAPDAPDRPSDASAKLASFKGALSRCLLFGEHPSQPMTMVFALEVGEDGTVHRADVLEGTSSPQLQNCAEQAMRSLRFAAFCGSDVELRWRVQVQ